MHRTIHQLRSFRAPSGQGLSLQRTKSIIDDILSSSSQAPDSLLQQTNNLATTLTKAVESNQLNPSGKHGKELSSVMGLLLKSHNRISLRATSNDLQIFESSKGILENLERWNLNFQPVHYQHAIAVANREKKWKDAAKLFWKQIDPEAGYNPVKVSVEDPQGLYAIAKFAQEENSSVADLVFDAVMQLSMVSPRDQSTYILAAGNALGQAGEWESAVEYLKTSYMATRLGQDLVSSVMQACVISGRPDEALKVYFDNSAQKGGIAEEWQWEGERDTADPLQRDLFMQASFGAEGLALTALAALEDAVKDQVTISHKALLGVALSCEVDQNVDGAMKLLDYILDTTDIAFDESFSDILASTTRTFNAASRFGMALFYMKRFSIAMGGREYHQDSSRASLLAATMASLCGMRCHFEANELFMYVTKTWPDHEYESARRIQAYAQRESKVYGANHLGNAWISAERHLERLLSTLQIISKNPETITPSHLELLLKGLALTMQSCTAAHHPNLSLKILALVEDHLRAHSSIKTVDITRHTDALTSEIIAARTWGNDKSGAIELFHSILEQNPTEMSRWRATLSAGLSALVVDGQGKDAVAIFQAMDEDALSVNCYNSIGRYLSRVGNPVEIGDLYQSALKTGSISEDLSLMAMAAVANSKIDNRIRVLRAMVDESAKSARLDRNKWMRTRYWNVKRDVGFYYARLLMWWNDPETCHLDELELAIDDFLERKNLGLKAKNDAIRVIVENARLYNSEEENVELSSWPNVPSTSEGWIELLLQIVEESKFTTLSVEPEFIDSLVSALHNLGASQECLDFIDTVTSNGANLRISTLLDAQEISNREEDLELSKDIRALLSDA